MVIKGLNEGRGRVFNKKKYILDTTYKPNQKRIAKEEAQSVRRRGYKARVVPIKIGFAVYRRKK